MRAPRDRKRFDGDRLIRFGRVYLLVVLIPIFMFVGAVGAVVRGEVGPAAIFLAFGLASTGLILWYLSMPTRPPDPN